MGGMRQVSPLMGMVALFLLIAPQPAQFFGQSDESLETDKLEHSVEDAMENMQALFEFGSPITAKDSRQISKAFEKLANHIIKKTNTKPRSSSEDQLEKVFHIKPADNANIRFSYRLPKGKVHTTSTSTGKRKKQPEYFLNFIFNNYRNPKKPLDRNTLVKKLKTRRTGRRLLPNGMPNPYRYFPLKGEDM
ncbi:uncharacterized protein LOC122621298 isoform X2 [Drosophila teissieri]|uniref:uncharacterized protein LOC122621298 isoform X2 n=1 Tax=Drosophila teissieri TaxID=7243 RepID=UPI001CBA5472|nr:uncharacterized protein LOC122621298 isoform X2 [Drosophila teissieri]